MKKGRYLISLFIASLCYGSASILIRLIHNLNFLTITFYRLLISSLIIILISLFLGELKVKYERKYLLILTSGFLLSIHFTFFILAVQKTSVANATFFVNTSPIFVAFLSPFLLKEHVSKSEVASVLMAIFGIFIASINLGEGYFASQNILGDLSAIASALLYCLYTIIGRKVRTSTSNWLYLSYVYSIATLTTLLQTPIWASPIETPQTIHNFILLFALAVIPTLFGHGLYNYALVGAKAVIANIIAILEPSIASLLAFFIFTEVPMINQIVGYLIIIGAISLVALKSTKTS